MALDSARPWGLGFWGGLECRVWGFGFQGVWGLGGLGFWGLGFRTSIKCSPKDSIWMLLSATFSYRSKGGPKLTGLNPDIYTPGN